MYLKGVEIFAQELGFALKALYCIKAIHKNISKTLFQFTDFLFLHDKLQNDSHTFTVTQGSSYDMVKVTFHVQTSVILTRFYHTFTGLRKSIQTPKCIPSTKTTWHLAYKAEIQNRSQTYMLMLFCFREFVPLLFLLWDPPMMQICLESLYSSIFLRWSEQVAHPGSCRTVKNHTA